MCSLYIGGMEKMADIQKLIGSESPLEVGQKINEIVNYKANKDLTNTGMITNCITEIPQRIKLELADGVLTLKAGSKVIVPNGFEDDGTTLKFDEVVTTKDLGVSSGTGQKILMVTSDGNNISTVSLSKSCSGATDSLSGETYHAWYDTNNNIIKRYGTDTSTPTSIVSFPIVIATFTDETYCTIDQVFNGMGYIGSTVWVDKGVKGLAPNGRNADGTLNNKLIEYTKVYTRTFTTSSSSPLWFAITSSGVSDLSASNYIHNEKENKIQKISTGEFQNPTILAGTYNRGTNGVISNFQPKQPFRAVDYNELKDYLPTGTIISSASPNSPTGYLYCNGSAVSRTVYAELFSVIGTTYGTGNGSTTFNLPDYTGYKFVTSNTISVKGNGMVLGLTNGEKNGGAWYSPGYGIWAINENYGGTLPIQQSSKTSMATNTMIGVTTDPTKSGITGSVSTATLKWYIKY